MCLAGYAKDPEQQKTLRVIDELIDMEEVRLLLPETVVTEFNNNKDRIIKESNQSFQVLSAGKSNGRKAWCKRNKKLVLGQLDDVNYRIPNLGHTSLNIIDNIEGLFKKATILVATEDIKLKALDRAVDKRAPFHRNKNSFNDAILMETYGAFIHEKNRAAIVHLSLTTHLILASPMATKKNRIPTSHPISTLLFPPISLTLRNH